eukprot:9461646-Lingulodinium_polyedra.AAC.1
MESVRRYDKPAKLLRQLALLQGEQLRRAQQLEAVLPGRLCRRLLPQLPNGKAMARAVAASAGKRRRPPA